MTHTPGPLESGKGPLQSAYRNRTRNKVADPIYEIDAIWRHLDTRSKPADDERLRVAVDYLERLSRLNPREANAATADDLYRSVKAVAETALSRIKALSND